MILIEPTMPSMISVSVEFRRNFSKMLTKLSTAPGFMSGTIFQSLRKRSIFDSFNSINSDDRSPTE